MVLNQDAPVDQRSPQLEPAICICNAGAVSPAGWGCQALMRALQQDTPPQPSPLSRPGWIQGLQVRPVPTPTTRPAFLKNPRLRRASAISQHTVAAALEALGADAAAVQSGQLRLGVVLCTMSGCVNYSRRFFAETLENPATASPLLFPETVFNAPASHLAALLQTTVVDYTLVGDTPTYFAGLAVAAHWLVQDRVDGCLVLGTEEMDWTTADAFRLFSRRILLSAGAGALYLKKWNPEIGEAILLEQIPALENYHDARSRDAAMQTVQSSLTAGVHLEGLLCDGLQGVPRFDRAERVAWKDWPGSRLSPKCHLGEGLTAATAWQCVAAWHTLREDRGHLRAWISNAGCNQQAGGVRLARAAQ